MPPAPNPQRPLAATPVLEGLLRRLRSRLTRQVWLFGAGTLLGLVSVWLAFAFFADWALRVPRGVRLFHLVVLIVLPLLAAWRFLVEPLRRRPDRAGLALLIERAHRGLHELLVSAVQLQERPTADGAPELVRRVLAEAEERSGRLELTGVLDERPPARRFAVGASLALGLCLAAMLSPVHTRTFLARLLGGSAAWPQRTHLELTIPLVADKAQVLASPGRLDVRVARGTDVPVVVRANGKLPASVTLHFVGSQDLVLSPSSDGVFRALLRARQEDLEFYATGGDDGDGEPRVFLEVLEPPDVAGLAVRIEPPAYTGLAARTEFDRDVEVIAGSELEVVMLPSPPDARGRARLLPADQILELAPAPFPARPPEEGAPAAAPVPEQQGLAFRITAHESLRFRFELEDESGLANPDPGLFAVHVLEDRRPEVEVLAPGRAEVDTVPGGTLALRAVASDDFGLASMGWSVFSASEGEESARLQELTFQPVAEWDSEGRGGRLAFGAGQRIEVTTLAGAGRSVTEGEQYVIQVHARDIRPASGDEGLGRSPQVRVRVVAVEEFLRRVQDRLARLRLRVSELEELQRQKQRLTQELLLSLESDAPELASAGSELNAVLAGQRRVGGDAEALVRELAAITEAVLYARVDDKALSLLEQMDAALAASLDRRFQYEVWRELASGWRRSAPAGPGLAAQLTGLLDLGLAIGLDDCRPAAAALERAGQHVDLTQVHAALLEASEHQARALLHIEDLLGRLAEWDNFQSILSLTRDILSRQKALMERTKHQVREK
jgi:hypothetical protein